MHMAPLLSATPGSFLKTVGGMRVDHELVSRREAMHVHGTSLSATLVHS